LENVDKFERERQKKANGVSTTNRAGAATKPYGEENMDLHGPEEFELTQRG
jgi:hypothetical protein